jgi:hypothetical protein
MTDNRKAIPPETDPELAAVRLPGRATSAT